MKKILLSVFLSAIVATGLYSQESPVLMSIGEDQIRLEEFERIYRKNNNEKSLNRQSPEEYLDLFIKFKLKVMEAESLGMDTTRKFVDELEGYRKQLAEPYLGDDDTKEVMMKEAYERAKEDIHVSHILIKLPPNPTPEDTIAAYEKISEIKKRIIKGEDFETVARATSDDGSANRNGGDLGYFTVFSMIYAFENVAYNTPVGVLSEPFRSSYGYHILKVHDRRPARGQVKVAHIFIRVPEDMEAKEKKEAYSKAQNLYDSLQAGKDFAQMAGLYSEDPSSAKNGGEIPWFGIGRMIKEFEDASFNIENQGEYTQPFKSYFGWHIIKLLETKGVGAYEDMKPELQEKANRGQRRQFHTQRYIDSLKLAHNFESYAAGLELAKFSVDSGLITGKWQPGKIVNDPTRIATVGNRTSTVGEFATFMEEKQQPGKSRHVQSYVDQLFHEFCNELALSYEESMLSEKYPEFRYIYQEYHDGILLFDIMDKMVWTKAVEDTAGLEAYHRAHRQEYMWPERAEAIQVSCREGANVKAVRKAYKKILKGKLNEAKLNQAYCTNDTIPCIELVKLLVPEGENELVDAMNGTTGLGPVNVSEDETSFVILKKIRGPEPKKLDEARGLITSDYQQYLEEQWVGELEAKYIVDVNRELLSRIKP